MPYSRPGMDAVLLRKHMGLKKIKGKQPGWKRLAVLPEDQFYAHVVLQNILQKVLTQSPICSLSYP